MTGIEVELHKYVINRDTTTTSKVLEQWATEELQADKCQHINIGEATVTVPSPMFDVVFIFYHLWHHQMNGGVGLRQLCDWAMLLHRYHAAIDPAQLEGLLQQAKLLRGWQLLGRVLTEHLGLPKQEFPLFRSSHPLAYRCIIRQLLHSGKFGCNDREDFLQRNTSKGLLHKLRTLFYMLRRNIGAFALSPRAAWQLHAATYWHGITHF